MAATVSGFRLVEYAPPGGGRRWSRVYPTALAATETAERVMAALAGRPARRPWRIDVVDAASGEPVATVRVGVDRDPGLCVACKQPVDPFGPVEQGQVSPPPTGGAHPTLLPVGGTPESETASDISDLPSQVDPSSLPGDQSWQVRPNRRTGLGE
jgi:hypothetical protein